MFDGKVTLSSLFQTEVLYGDKLRDKKLPEIESLQAVKVENSQSMNNMDSVLIRSESNKGKEPINLPLSLRIS